MTKHRQLVHVCAGGVALCFLAIGQPALAEDGDGGATRHVNCRNPGASIQREINKANSVKPTTIVIKGVCIEAVTVAKDDITLMAHPDGGTVDGSISVVGGQRVTIDGLKITGLGDGVAATDNASVNINNAVLEKNSRSGVFATRSALVVLQGNTIRLNDWYGVLVQDGANAQIRANNTIESDVAELDIGTAIGGYRHATIRIRDGGNTITNRAMNTPSDPQNLSTFEGFAIDVEHLSLFRQDSGHAVITGHIYIFNLTTADFRDMEYLGYVFIDGLNANFRVRNSTVSGGMTMFGIADVRSDVTFAGDVYCNFNYLNPVIPTTGTRYDCFP